MTATPTTPDFAKLGGLLPCVVQHAQTGQVLMLGYMNAEAYAQTLSTRKVTFYSRSKGRLWVKGESSGHVLTLAHIALDCDQDALLALAHPAGPTCHTGEVSCFGEVGFGAGSSAGPSEAGPFAVLSELEAVLRERRSAPTQADTGGSYAARLLSSHPRHAAQKVGEEGVEVALAALSQSDEELSEEAADLLFHLMLLLTLRGLSLSNVLAVLKRRRNASGEQEQA